MILMPSLNDGPLNPPCTLCTKIEKRIQKAVALFTEKIKSAIDQNLFF